MTIFHLYILECSDGSYYVGHTDNIAKRLSEHNLKKYSGYTSTRLPVKLVFHEPCHSRIEALIAERKIKKWTRKKKKLLISGGWEALSKRIIK